MSEERLQVTKKAFHSSGYASVHLNLRAKNRTLSLAAIRVETQNHFNIKKTLNKKDIWKWDEINFDFDLRFKRELELFLRRQGHSGSNRRELREELTEKLMLPECPVFTGFPFFTFLLSFF